MNLNAEEKKILSKYLNDNLKYSETYAEFYDHLLTALENRNDHLSFKDGIDRIIADDFGGVEGIRVIEARYQCETVKEIRKRYFNYITDCFKFPSIYAFTIGSALTYFLTVQPWFSFNWFLAIIVLMAILPALLNTIRYINAGYVWRSKKESIKDRGFSLLRKYNPIIIIAALLVTWHFFRIGGPYDLINNAPGIVRTMFLIVYALHTISFYKVYHDEFKVNIAK